jgi:hypothetical protein
MSDWENLRVGQLSFGMSGLRVSKIVASKGTGASAKMAQKARIGVYNIKTCQYNRAFTKSILRRA